MSALDTAPASYGRRPLLSRERELQLARRIQRGDPDAKRELIESNLRLVISIAFEHRGRGVPLADLVQEGCIGLTRAAERFDHRRGLRFSTYAVPWIRYAMGRAVAAWQRQSARMRSLDEPLYDEDAPALVDRLPDPSAELHTDADPLEDERIRRRVAALPPRHRMVVERSFGLGGQPEESLSRIADRLDVSRERVRQLRSNALVRLRAA
jgi:RNA polymerase sigma factor (sigma-70 family)